MADDLRDLMELMPQPEQPHNASGNWNEAEHNIGTRLPNDYKRFVETYGTGAIGRMPVWIFSALASGGHELKQQCEAITQAYEDLFAESPELLPYPLYPNKGGLLYFGATGNGDYLHWLTDGPPEHWKVIVHHFGDTRFVAFEINMVGFLVNLLSRKYDVFLTTFFEPPVVFASYKQTCCWPASS